MAPAFVKQDFVYPKHRFYVSKKRIKFLQISPNLDVLSYYSNIPAITQSAYKSNSQTPSSC